jgi:ribosome-binding ATPase YchF (GTP1/OBG family)
LTAGATLSIATGALASTEALDRIATHAQDVRREAENVRRLLNDRKADVTVVTERLAVLDTHAQALKDAMEAAMTDATVTAVEPTSWARARAATDSLLAIVANKSRLLADTERADRDRGLLRAKADAIAKRAAMVEQHVSRARG